MTKRTKMRRGEDGAVTARHLASFRADKGHRPTRVQAHCYVCSGAHTWAERCPEAMEKGSA